jgi:hypothetical protein
MSRKYPYYPAWNGEATDPVTKKFYDLCKRRWAFTNLGMYANRPMRGSKNLSVHATGFAVDMGYPKTRAGRATAKQAWDWLILYSEELRICEIHDYAYGDWGRGYRCSRGEGEKGIKVFTATDNAGTPGGAWLHVEVSNDWESAEEMEKMWRSLPKP